MPDKGGPFDERGRTGLKQYSGFVREEFLKELRGRNGLKVFREMRDNDPIVGAVMYTIDNLIREVTWQAEPASQDAPDVEAAEYLDSCIEDMSLTWSDQVSEFLEHLVFGWSYHELVYKRRMGDTRDGSTRSKFTDGRIGWRKMPIRSQDSLMKWEWDEEGGIYAMVQQAPPDFAVRTIEIEKALLFRTTAAKGNPEGRSMLRNAYRPWYFKRRLEEVEAIGIERDLAGLPVLTPPEGDNIWDPNDPDMVNLRDEAEEMVQNVRRDELEGVLKPYGWTFELLSSGGSRQINVGETIERYDRRIAMTALADFIMIGHVAMGSYALVSSKKNIFGVALSSTVKAIAEVINRHAVPRLFALNGWKLDSLPQLRPGDVEAPPLDELGTAIKDLTGVGVLTPDPGLEDFVRQWMGLPERTDEGMESAEDLKELGKRIWGDSDAPAA